MHLQAKKKLRKFQMVFFILFQYIVL